MMAKVITPAWKPMDVELTMVPQLLYWLLAEQVRALAFCDGELYGTVYQSKEGYWKIYTTDDSEKPMAKQEPKT